MCCVLRNIKYFIMLQLSFSGLSDWQVCSAEESSSFYPFDKALRQNFADQDKNQMTQITANRGPAMDTAKGETFRVTEKDEPPEKRTEKTRSTPQFISRPHYCDYMAKPCIHAYVTGKICAKTIYDRYVTFDTYCMMEYANCREGFELWQMLYAGACFQVKPVAEYMFYPYQDDLFLDNYYILEDKTKPKFYETDVTT